MLKTEVDGADAEGLANSTLRKTGHWPGKPVTLTFCWLGLVLRTMMARLSPALRPKAKTFVLPDARGK
jgi:hypothetical protein